MTVMALREFEDLWAAQEAAGGTQCQLDPVAFDEPARTSKQVWEFGKTVSKVCRHCPALAACRRFADKHPEVRGVIAGYIRYPKSEENRRTKQ